MNLIKFTLLLFILLAYGYATPVYQVENSPTEYLYIGEVNFESQYKLLDLVSQEIVWINKDRLKQVSEFTPEEFFKTLKNNELIFSFDLLQSNYDILLSPKGQLTISDYEGDDKNYKAKIGITPTPIDNVFLLMFHVDNHPIYGVIRELSVPCDITMELSTYFEVFINYQEDIYKGCVYLGK